ncbi:carbohydrate-binding domain-containing protein [Zafaria sp. Z1313]|uniref:carbohydrate-binding domain-containing protein n=1 Tax=unclassified Zafaria TaxID=2828765 RepID=UPI002E7A714A|nr:carbohydrate-binding domain-containing protein [Zafaria sp. J156]MEE1621700.1 carbohydrate-binding domain-containing protein [Zafaria sp. J156]
MKRTIQRTTLAATAATLAAGLALTGCAATAATTTGTDADAASGTTGTETTLAATSADTATSIDQTHFDENDLSWDTAEEVEVALADGASTGGTGVEVDGDTVTITAAGTYRVSGSLADGQLRVAAPDDALVRVVFDGVSLASSTGSPLVVESADEVVLFLEDGSSNSVSDAADYADTSDDAPDAAVYSASDLTIAGGGSLDVAGNFNDAVNTKDGLVLAGGTVNVTAVDDGIRGKDYVVLLAGDYTVDAADDGLKADNEEDEGRGWLLVQGGTLTVAAGDDGVKAYNKLTVSGGTVTVTESEEGLEAAHLEISGGTVDVTANDDGLNAAGGTSSETEPGGAAGTQRGGPGSGTAPEGAPGAAEAPAAGGPQGAAAGDYSILISGGSVVIDADGDGLDSNGSATITGGTVVVNGPEGSGNGALDVDGEFLVEGGTLVAAGSAGMAIGPSASSSQSGIQATLPETVPAGTVLQITDSNGELIATFTVAKATGSLVFSSADFVDGETYSVYVGGTATQDAGLEPAGSAASLDGAEEAVSVVAGEYSSGMGGGMRGGQRP